MIPGTFFRQQSAYPDEEKLETSCHSSPSNECRKLVFLLFFYPLIEERCIVRRGEGFCLIPVFKGMRDTFPIVLKYVCML